MINPMAPLSEEELDELDHFLLHEVDSDEVMTLDIMDGFLHAIAIGPTAIHPKEWLPKVWGLETMAPPMDSIQEVNHVLGLVMRHFNGIIAGLEGSPPDIYPIWPSREFEGKECDEGEGWAYGFVEGMRLRWNDWQPLLETEAGKAWYLPIGLLGEDDFGPDQDDSTRTPIERSALSQQIPDAVLAMHSHWLPLRQAIHERDVARAMQPKVGRNDPCPCGSGKKFKKCCGAAVDLH